jgi:hypothetical protein
VIDTRGDFMLLKDLSKGEYFTRKSLNGQEAKPSQVYIKDDYDRSSKKYWCQKWNDISSGIELKGDTEVYQDFIF